MPVNYPHYTDPGREGVRSTDTLIKAFALYKT